MNEKTQAVTDTDRSLWGEYEMRLDVTLGKTCR